MKKTIKSILLLSSFILIFTSLAIADKKPFEGKVKYKISYEGSNLNEAVLASLPKEMTILIKDNFSKTTLNTQMGKTVNIFNSEEMYSITLINAMGQKYAIRSSSDMINKEIEKGPKPQIEYSDETKEIAGYTCKKAIVTIADEILGTESKLIVYYTNAFKHKNINKDNPIFNEIDGIMLEYQMDAQGMLMQFTASSVEETRVSRKEFDIPKDYEVTTQEELKTKFGM